MTFLPRSEDHDGQAVLLRQTVGLLGSLPQLEPPADLRARVAMGLAQAGDLKPMTCAHVAQALDPYLEAELSEAEERALHLHLVTCKRCRRQVEQARAAIRLTQEVAEVAPPVRVRERLADEMADRVPSRHRLRPAARRLFAVLVPLAAAAAVVLVVRTYTPSTDVPSAADTRPALTAEQPAQPDELAPAVAASPQPAPAVAVAAAVPMAPAHRRHGGVGGLIRRVAESVVPPAVAEAAARPDAAAEAEPAPEPETGRMVTQPGPADRMAEMAERESVIESEAMLAKVPAAPADDAERAEAAASNPETPKPRLEIEIGRSDANEPTPLESPRKTLDVRTSAIRLPDVIRPGRNRPRSVDLPLIRREY